MIYQILVVFALLIGDEINAASKESYSPPQVIEYKDIGEMNVKREETIGWNLTQLGKTMPVSKGHYAAYRRDGDGCDLELFWEFPVKKGNEVLDVSICPDFDLDKKYVIYGIEHDGMEFAERSESSVVPRPIGPINLDSLTGKKYTKSEEKCFKNCAVISDFKKANVEQMNKKHDKKTIEWNLWAPQTKDIPVGFYALYKKDGKVLTFINTFAVKSGQEVIVSDLDGFDVDATYVIYGYAHDEMEFSVDATPTNWEQLKGQVKLIRSEENCFKNSSWLMKKELTKENVEAMNKKHEKTIEWIYGAPCTKDIPVGWYDLYKKAGEVWTFVASFIVKKRGDKIIVSDANGYNVDATYVVYGYAHNDMEFKSVPVDGKTGWQISNGNDLAKDDLKYIRSEEKCFKNNNNNGIIGPIISIAVLLALCACCVFGCRYFKKKKRGNSSRV